MADPGRATTVVVGAGVAGLACARGLAAAGQQVLVLDRARGVGGRCATRLLEGLPFDHGATFLHGRDPAFLAELDRVPATRLPGWPAAVRGAGQPCQPEAFTPGEQRLAFAEGVNAFPRHLAAGLDVRLETAVSALEEVPGGLLLRLEAGAPVPAEQVVLALAAEQALRLLGTVPAPPPEVASARALLGLAQSQACLALLAIYPEAVAHPDWQVCFPERSRVLQLLSNESSKRHGPGRLGLLLQARPAWSRAHLEDPAWGAALLEEAASLLGPWAARPAASHAHRWSFARNDRSSELAGPMLLSLSGGGRLGICGDRFAPGGGVEGAWRSGQLLSERLLAAEGER